MKRITTILLAFALSATAITAQNKLTREQILAMSTDELSELPLDELMQAVETLGVSSVDELFALIMNKSVSSASKSEESSFTAPMSTTVITHDELRTYGITTIEEAMRLIPGMIVSQKTNGIYDIQVRGLNNIPDNNMLLYTENNTTLLMVDGRNVHDYSIGAMSMDQLPISIEDVERIEVVRGACSALYGTNAMNGIINIVTRKPSNAKTPIAGSVHIGNQSTLVADFALRSKINDKIALGLSANMQNRERPTDKIYVTPNEGFYMDTQNQFSTNAHRVTADVMAGYFQSGALTKVEGVQLMTLDDINKLRQLTPNPLDPASYDIYNVASYEFDNAYDVFKNPKLARKNFGLNGYVELTPAENIRLDLTGGYSEVEELNTTLVEMPYSFTGRKFKAGYVNADARIEDLHIQMNFAGGPSNYVFGRPGFQVTTRRFFGTVEYDIHVGDLTIRPAIACNYYRATDDKKDGDYSGFFEEDGDGYGEISSIAPSVRLDYKVNDWRFILSARSDKTDNPDKWNTSAQAVVSKQFNEKNFLRFNYGLGMRSSNMVTAGCQYKWNRYGAMSPNFVQFMSAPDAEVTKIHNFEIGYRIKPTNNLLIDAEVFYSRSTDYQTLTAAKSQTNVSESAIEELLATASKYLTPEAIAALQNPETSAMAQGYIIGSVAPTLMRNVSTTTFTQGGNMPFEVHQFGLGTNIDWVISSKLIAKLNFNVQRTLINNYYRYDQTANIKAQITNAMTQTMTAVNDIMLSAAGLNPDLTSINTTRTSEEFFHYALGGSMADELQDWFHSLPETEQATFVQTLRDSYYAGQNEVTYNGQTYENPIALYYGLKYNIKLNEGENGEAGYFTLGRSEQLEPKLEDKHVHEATPTLYGMAGVIWKPMTQLNLSAYANFMSKRTYVTSLGEQKLNPRFTVNLKVGWKPAEQVEIFANANNLFNNHKQEFIYSDKIGGIYTVGVNFGF